MILLASLNPVFRAAGENTEMGWLMGMTTVFFLLTFVGWFWYAYNPANRARWESMGRLPLDDKAAGGDR